MFTIEQINDLHVRLGSAKTFPEYAPGLKALSVERCDSYMADGHSEYLGPARCPYVILLDAESNGQELCYSHSIVPGGFEVMS
jgi:hypothetical protein